MKVTKEYSFLAKFFHWGFALLFIYGVLRQVGDVEELADLSLLRREFFFAGFFLLFLFIRFLYMRLTHVSSLPEDAPEYQRLAARAVHLGMYVSAGLIAVSGIVIGFLHLGGYGSGFVMDLALGFHGFSVSAAYWLIFIHVAAAIYHRLLGDNVWDSMVPFWKVGGKKP